MPFQMKEWIVIKTKVKLFSNSSNSNNYKVGMIEIWAKIILILLIKDIKTFN